MYATANIYERVVRITLQDGKTGTGTVIERAGKAFVVTARHVLPENPAEQFTFGNRFRSWTGTSPPLPGTNADADVAAFQVPDDWAMPHLPIELTSEGIIFSQDALFFGFPYAYSFRLNQKDGIPFVKKATISAIDARPSDRLSLFYLDGINNPGFSGGPVVVAELKKTPKLFAIVSEFKAEHVPLYIDGAPTPHTVETNTGIMVAYDIHHALEALPSS
jgi:hypothetical protein